MREVSDRLCREAKLSVIENPGGHGRNYGEWIAEKNGQPTHRGTIRADIDRAILASTTEAGFIKVMQEMGYEFKTRTGNGAPLKYPALKPPGASNESMTIPARCFHSRRQNAQQQSSTAVRWVRTNQSNTRAYRPFTIATATNFISSSGIRHPSNGCLFCCGRMW